MSEVGIIGQMYEDRRTKKQGKLVERDEKFKTLLLESSDGKSFNITFSGFKSNWRKLDEPVQTVEEAMEEVVPEEVSSNVEKPVKTEVKKSKVKKSSKKYKEQNVSEGFEKATLKCLDYVKSFNLNRITSKVVPNKRRVTIKVDNERIFVITYMVRNAHYQVSVSEKLFMQIKDREYISNERVNEDWNTTTKYTFDISEDSLDRFLVDTKDFIADYVCEEDK